MVDAVHELHVKVVPDFSDVHSAAIDDQLRFFSFGHLPERLQLISQACHDVAHFMANVAPPNEQLRLGLQRLLEAKDCFVRAAVVAEEG